MHECTAMVSYMKELGNTGQMTGEVALCPLGNTLTAPCDQYILREAGVGVNDFDVGELNTTLGEFFDKVVQFTICCS